jgi:5-methylcytosine-specific restriction endonuclease McrA
MRADRVGKARTEYEKARRKILLTEDVCGICGNYVDKSLQWPHPMSACVDHIIPVDKGGHPFSRDNLQLAHMCCNRQKSDKLITIGVGDNTINTNRLLPHTIDWRTYKG